jgi:hypothetical protein
MPSANVSALQTAVNRIAQRGAFSPVTVDGGLGPQTDQGVMNALAWVVHNVSSKEETAVGLVSALSDGDLQGNIAQSAQGLATFLNDAADEAGLPAAPGATPAQSSGGSGGGFSPTSWVTHNPFTPGNGPLASTIAAWQKLATWQKVAAVGIGILGVVYVRKKLAAHDRRRGA